MKKIIMLGAALLAINFAAFAQDYRGQQSRQQRVIENARRRNRITDNEYYKLMREQEAIRYAIDKYDADGVWTPHERNVVNDKLYRAERRLKKYKNNREVY